MRWRRLARNRLSFAALWIILAITAASVAAPWLAPYDPDNPDAESTLSSVSWRHPLGTDVYGRDQLSRLIHAGRIDLLVALSATAIALTLGSAVGAVAGYRGGWVDQVVMRGVDQYRASAGIELPRRPGVNPTTLRTTVLCMAMRGLAGWKDVRA